MSVLSVVRNELRQGTRVEIDNQIKYLKNITLIDYNPVGGERKEFARLISSSGLCLGRGESACMAYARFHNHVVGSSNLRDIKEYCNQYGIQYLTTWDFLYYAYRKSYMTKSDIEEFVSKVRAAGSILPDQDIEAYVCNIL